jgi:hypothetical protein
MAERIVSPGVFTREKDLSFLPQGIGEIGAAIVGPTQKGPAFTPTIINNFSEFEEIFGTLDSRFYVPYTAKQYLKSAGTVTIVRVLGIGGYQSSVITLKTTGSLVATDTAEANPEAFGKTLAILAPTRLGGLTGANVKDLASALTGAPLSASLLEVSASTGNVNKTISFNTGSEDYIDKLFPSDPQNNTEPVYLYKNFKQFHGNITGYLSGSIVIASFDSAGLNLSDGATSFNSAGTASAWTGNQDYSYARTPYLQSQNVGSSRYSLFRVYTRSHGDTVNSHFKIHILNVKDAGSVAGSDYGTFSLQVRSVNFTKDRTRVGDDSVIEQWDNLTFDSNESNYFARVIGDRHISIDSDGKLTYYGDYPNRSKHIRVGDYGDIGTFPTTVVPFGHNKVYVPYYSSTTAATTIVTASFKRNQSSSIADFDQNAFYGFDYSNLDNRSYLSSVSYGSGGANQGNNVTMSLENMYGSDGATAVATNFSGETELLTLSGSAIEQRKFVVPFQWGFDGFNPSTQYATGGDIAGSNTQGFNLNTSSASGSIVYKRAINAVSNPDEFDINMMVLPGVIHSIHSTVTNHAIDKVEERADTFLILDTAQYGDSVDTVRDNVKTLDSNYTATYYPWVKVLDENTNRPTWVPPSVVLPGVISFNDNVAHEWFAPAGLNRGGLSDVLEAKTRLTHSERDKLYEDRINPIATFPGQGVVVFGQKTLQGKPSALDRVNVRRLLIALKKFIASTSRFLVFEQNTNATRARFLNVVNPFLEDVQANSGLSAFRVVMDDTNNTPDEIDRNRLIGQIFIQPTRTAEFIVLDFVVQPTGATFPE